MKKTLLIALLIPTLLPAYAHSAITCLFKDSVSTNTPNRNCSSHCGNHADAQPVETLTLNMNEVWAKKSAFYNNATIRCEGGNGCGYKTLGTPRTFNSGKSVDASYKTWSIPTKIILEADLCISE